MVRRSFPEEGTHYPNTGDWATLTPAELEDMFSDGFHSITYVPYKP